MIKNIPKIATFKVANDSMMAVNASNDEASFNKNDIIVFDRTISPLDGDYVIASKDNNSDCLLFKRLQIIENRRYLISINQKYLPIEMDDTINIIGVVTEKIKSINHGHKTILQKAA